MQKYRYHNRPVLKKTACIESNLAVFFNTIIKSIPIELTGNKYSLWYINPRLPGGNFSIIFKLAFGDFFIRRAGFSLATVYTQQGNPKGSPYNGIEIPIH